MFEKYYQVSNLSEAITLLAEEKEKLKIIAGGTDLWLENKNKIHEDIDGFIDISRIQGLDRIYFDKKQKIHIDPLVTHAHCVRSSIIKSYAFCLYEACKSVGSPQIRNRGTVAGNVVTGSPANDTIPALMVLDAVIVVESVRGKREIPIVEFYKGVRKTDIQEDEIITDIWFKKPDLQKTNSKFVKMGLRKSQAISVLNFALFYTIQKDLTIEEMRLAFGSLTPTVIRARAAEQYTIGKKLSEIEKDVFINLALSHIDPISDIRSTQEYRKQAAAILLKRSLEKILTGEIKNEPNGRDVTLWGSNSKSYVPVSESSKLEKGSIINVVLNGKMTSIQCDPGMSLLDAIRDQSGYTGAKEGCGEGECGSCTVYMDGLAVLACLIPVQRAANAKVETIESLAVGGKLNNLQQHFVEENAIQCGFCTPGFVMSANKLLDEIKKPTEDEIKIAISGNLCRCTGYYKIIKAIEKAAELR